MRKKEEIKVILNHMKMYRLRWISYFVSINERHSKCLYNGILSSVCGIHIQIWLIKGASKKNKLGHRDMREIVNIEELILKIQVLNRLWAKTKKDEHKTYSKGPISKQRTTLSTGWQDQAWSTQQETHAKVNLDFNWTTNKTWISGII